MQSTNNEKNDPQGAGVNIDHSFTLNTTDRHAVTAGAECPDGPRYKAIGNSKAVPVVRWVGQRILDRLAALRNTDAN